MQKYYRKVLYIKGLIKKNIFGIFPLKGNYIFLRQLVFRFTTIAIIAIYKLLKIRRRVFIFKIFFYNILRNLFAYAIFINKYLLAFIFTKIFLIINNNLLYIIIYAVKKGIPPNNLRKSINLGISEACLTLGFIIKILLESIIYKRFNKNFFFKIFFLKGSYIFLK